MTTDDEARWLAEWSEEFDRGHSILASIDDAAVAAVAAIAAMNGAGHSVDADKDEPLNVPLDWAAEFAHDYSAVDWMPGKLCERGQQVSFVGDGKVGKSLFWFEWAWRAAAGLPFLHTGALEPLTIVYADRENSRRDLVMRARALGASPDALVNVVYYSFPQLAALDENASGLLDLVDQAGGDVVILDTVSRFVAGKENDSETWLGLYRRVHARLKAENRTGVRLDHMGKDSEKGARGSSAKDQDVDVVWEMTARTERESSDGVVTSDLRLTRTHTRTGMGPGVMDIIRVGTKDRATDLWVDGETTHRLAGSPHAAPPIDRRIADVVATLDGAGIDPMLGRDRLVNEVANRRLNIRLSNGEWSKVVKARKDAAAALRMHEQHTSSDTSQDVRCEVCGQPLDGFYAAQAGTRRHVGCEENPS